jgi:hypothetical protein
MYRPLLRALIFLTGLACLATAAGCSSTAKPRDFKPVAVRFFLESSSGDGTPVSLPKSGVNLIVNPKPVVTEGDIVNVELVKVELGQCLLFQLTPAATRDFYRLSVTHQGRRVVLVLDNVALGARRMDGVITNGSVFIFVELPDGELPALVENLKKSSAALQKELARK